MAIHYFHCTDGIDLVIDRQGQRTRTPAEVQARAAIVAQELMRALPDYREWSNWAVHVYDEIGEVDIVPFPAEQRRAA